MFEDEDPQYTVARPRPVKAKAIKKKKKPEPKKEVFHFSRYLAATLYRMFKQNPHGPARNIIEIGTQLRLPKSVNSLEGLDQFMRRKYMPYCSNTLRQQSVMNTSWRGIPSSTRVLPLHEEGPRDNSDNQKHQVTTTLVVTVRVTVSGRDLRPQLDQGMSAYDAVFRQLEDQAGRAWQRVIAHGACMVNDPVLHKGSISAGSTNIETEA